MAETRLNVDHDTQMQEMLTLMGKLVDVEYFELHVCGELDFSVYTAVAGGTNADGEMIYCVGASVQDLDAMNDLLRKLIDGGICLRCGKHTAFEAEVVGSMPGSETLCWIQWDPELKRYRRGCE